MINDKDIIKKVNVTEIERKFLINNFTREVVFEKEYLIWQWFYYEGELECKIKLIIDILTFKKKWVKVSKCRVNDLKSEKQIFYLNESSVDFTDLINMPFVCKRRSIFSDIQLDHFIFSNNFCEYLLEDEHNTENLIKFCERMNIELGLEVTNNKFYRNVNLTTNFNTASLKYLEFILNIYK